MIKLIFFGTPLIAAYALQCLIKHFHIIAVVTQPDKPIGRKKIREMVPVKKIALDEGIKIFQPKNLTMIENDIARLQPDLGILFAYSEIIPKSIIDIFPNGIVNIHPSLLPKYRGPSPVQSAILANEKITGVSIIRIDTKIDHGPILAQKTLEIKNETADELMQKLTDLGMDLLIETIPKYLEGKIQPQEQNHREATFTKIIKREDGKIDWNKTAEDIYRQYRAYQRWPGIYTTFNNKRLKILKLNIIKNDAMQKQPGMPFFTSENDLAIQCCHGSIIASEVQLEGKKPTTGKNFILGHPEIINKKFL